MNFNKRSDTVLHFILGRSGSLKTTRICKMAAESLRNGKSVYFFVPEQQALSTEKKMIDLLADESSEMLEILNFKRLCNYVFRKHGGLSYNYISNGGRVLCMWRAINTLAPELNEYRSFRNDGGLACRMLSTIDEMKLCRITPSMLDDASERLPEDMKYKGLKSKLSDIAKIYSLYNQLVATTREDPADDLSKAAELLDESDFFVGSDVYFDSFNGFTPIEFEIISKIMKSADSLTVSLCLDRAPDGTVTEPFIKTSATASKLIRIAQKLNIEFDFDICEKDYRTESGDLLFLEKNLWSLDVSDSSAYPEKPENIRIIEAGNIFEECDAVAADICSKVRQGALMRDFAVVMRGIDRYDGIIDAVFEKYGLPCFISKRTDLSSKPVAKLILSALAIKSGGFRTGDVINYIKSGLTGVDPDDLSLLEAYAETWDIRGEAAWERIWEMDPSGYTMKQMTEASAEKLDKINDVREKIMTPLRDLFAKLDLSDNVVGYSRAVYEFLINLGVPEKLEAEACKFADDGNRTEADEICRVFSAIVDSLDELCSSLSDFKCDEISYAKLLTLVLDKCEIGRIPATIDEILIGDASLIRSNCPHIYLLGVNEGIFPASPSDTGILTDGDRRLLDTIPLGIELSGNFESRSADERFDFYRTVTSANKSVTLLYSRSDISGNSLKPSLGIFRVKKLFPLLKIENYSEFPIEKRLEGRQKLPEYAAEVGKGRLYDALVEYASEDSSMLSRLSKLHCNLSENEVALSAETTEKLNGGNISLSQSKLDSFVSCHFAYYCQYVLKLEEEKQAKFDARSIGTFIHSILEMFMSQSADKLSELSDEEIDDRVDRITADFLKDVLKITPETGSSRLTHLFGKLRRSAKLVCRSMAAEFSKSEFVPTLYEVPIKYSNDNSIDPLEIKLDDGTTAHITGIIDRVDTLSKDGKLYVRVNDYKTGDKEFDLDDVSKGLNTQLLLYLFSIWKNGGKNGSALYDIAKDKTIVPAGILYFLTTPAIMNLSTEATSEEITEKAASTLKRSGLLIADEDILRAMEPELEGKYIPIKAGKEGKLNKPDILRTVEGFEELLTSVENTIRSIGNEIKSGNASAKPMNNKKKNACEYCSLKPVCRHDSCVC